MQHFKLGFRNKTVLEQLGICERTVTAMAARPDLVANLAQLTDATTTVAAARTSHQRIAQLQGELKAEVLKRNSLLRSSREKVTYVSLGVAVTTAFDPLGMLAAGLKLEASKTVRVGKPAAPENLRGEPTDNEGEARLRWRRPLRRCTFVIEYRRDDTPDQWTYADSTGQQTCLIQGLTSGVKYWFRVHASNAHGPGPMSNPAPVRVK